nr:MAG TPA: Kringle domain [Caudoviricetes sp.]
MALTTRARGAVQSPWCFVSCRASTCCVVHRGGG